MTRLAHPVTFAYCTEFGMSTSPTITIGTALTNACGASNADGAAAVQIGSGALTHDCELLEVIVSDCTGDATGVDSSTLLDILIDPAGGTSWDTTNRLIQSLMVGYLVTNTNGGTTTWRRWMFPLWVKSGASFAGIGRSIIASAQTPTVFLRAWGGTKSNTWWCGTRVDAIGETRATSNGTLRTYNPGANTWDTAQSIGAVTARRYSHLIPSVCMGAISGSSVLKQMQVQIGGVTVGGTYTYGNSSIEQTTPILDGTYPNIWCDVPQGTQLQFRLKPSSATSTTDQVIIHGIA